MRRHYRLICKTDRPFSDNYRCIAAKGCYVRDSDIAAFFVTVRSCAKQPLMVGTFKISLGTSATQTGVWIRSLLERKPTRLVTVAIANKTARTAWVLLAKGETYRVTPAIQA